MRLIKLTLTVAAAAALSACGAAQGQTTALVGHTAEQQGGLRGATELQRPAPLTGDAVLQPAGGQTDGLRGVAQPVSVQP